MIKKFLMLALSLVFATVILAGCAEGATLQGEAVGGSAAGADAETDAAVLNLDQVGQILGLHFRYSSAWEKLVDNDTTMSFRIPGGNGDYYAVISGEKMDFSDAADPEQARQDWAKNAVDFIGTDTVLNYSIGSPSYYYYALDGEDEVIGLTFFNGDDFYELQCSGPGTENASVMGAWSEVIDTLTLD